MYKVLKRTCRAIVLPISSFVFPCPRCRRRRGLLKVSSVMEMVNNTYKLKSCIVVLFCNLENYNN